MVKFVSGDITQLNLTNHQYTFKKEVDGVAIINDGNNEITITINGNNYILKVGEGRLYLLPSFRVVAFSDDAVFRMTGIKKGE